MKLSNEKVKGIVVGVVITTIISTVIKKLKKKNNGEKHNIKEYQKDYHTLLAMFRCASRYMNGIEREMTDEGMTKSDIELEKSFREYYNKNSQNIRKNCYENTGCDILNYDLGR